MAVTAKNTVSMLYKEDNTFAANNNRSYFFIVMLEGASGSIAFGGGDGYIPLKELEHYAPPVCPTGEIEIKASGQYVIHMG